jgi:Rad3-related DNA helicase
MRRPPSRVIGTLADPLRRIGASPLRAAANAVATKAGSETLARSTSAVIASATLRPSSAASSSIARISSGEVTFSHGSRRASTRSRTASISASNAVCLPLLIVAASLAFPERIITAIARQAGS